jgi:dihydrofolate reductase
VFSRRPLAPETDVIVTTRSPTEVAVEMRALGVRRAWLVGGAALAASFRAEALISEYILSVMPVVLGGGVPLFAGSGEQERLRLVESTQFVSGVVQTGTRRGDEVPRALPCRRARR